MAWNVEFPRRYRSLYEESNGHQSRNVVTFVGENRENRRENWGKLGTGGNWGQTGRGWPSEMRHNLG